MLQLWNKSIFLLLCAIVVNSCGFMDLRPIGIDITPNRMDSLLSDSYSPVIIRFDTEVIKNETEGILQVSSDYGQQRGDKYWIGNVLYFVPIQGWTPGIRYTLNLTGTVRSVDGREMRIEHFVSFYAINKNEAPVLEWFSPSNGESIGTNNPVFEFHFSKSMNKLSVESALNLEGIGGKTYEWSADDKVLKVIPDNSLNPWISYRWNIRDSAKSIDGVPVPKTYSGNFTTDLDQTLPFVANVYPVLFSDGFWFPTGANIETGLGQGHGIAVSFNKPIGENALRSLRFEPSLTGRTEFLSETSIVFIFTRDPEPETIYTLIVSGDTKDNEGLKIGEDYKVYFVPDIPILNILSITTDSGAFMDNFTEINNILPVNIHDGTGELTFSVHFSLPFNFEEKLTMPQKITLTPFFPRTLPPIALQYINWISDDRLLMRWEGLTAGDNDIHYYRLTIPGGRGGISSSAGYYMKHDITIILEAIK